VTLPQLPAARRVTQPPEPRPASSARCQTLVPLMVDE
jgi:hypothetical protein